jgi:hypothetical protein
MNRGRGSDRENRDRESGGGVLRLGGDVRYSQWVSRGDASSEKERGGPVLTSGWAPAASSSGPEVGSVGLVDWSTAGSHA